MERKSKKYWLSFILLLFPCLFKFSLFNGPILFIYQYLNINAAVFDKHLIILRLINFISLTGLIILLIMVFEACFSIKTNCKKNVEESLYSFIYYPQFKIDVIILIIIIIGIFVSYLDMDLILSKSIMFYFYLLLSVAGIYMNCSIIFPWKSYRTIENSLIEQKDIFQEAWFCIPTHTKISTFSILPGECSEIPVVLTERELLLINKRKNCKLKGSDFNKLLVYIDETSVKDDLRHAVEQYSSYQHMRCLIILKEESQNSQFKEEIDILKNRLEAQIIYKFQNIYSLNILDKYIGIKYTYNVVKCLREGNSLQNMGKLLDNVYLNIIHGPTIAIKFFRICLTEPNIQKALYQFFDYIDLQYRLACSFFAPADLNWYTKKSSNIGNLRDMFQFLAGNLKDLLTMNSIETKYIFDSNIWDVLEYYLPNNIITLQNSQNLNSEEIKELSAELRNRLRAHQDIQLAHVPVVLNLLFRISIATNYMLEINHIAINCDHDGNITGSYGNISDKSLFPFLKMEQGFYWIFNNARKEDGHFRLEYVNFLTGGLNQTQLKQADLKK